MNKLLVGSAVVAAMLFSGCSLFKDVNLKEDQSTSSEEVVSKVEGVVLDKVYFDFDRFDLRGDMFDVVRTNAALITTKAKSASIVLEGNSDEWGSDEYNQALGLKRAKAVKDALVDQGLDADKITIKSFGESNLVCTEKTPECDALNRRVEFKVIQ